MRFQGGNYIMFSSKRDRELANNESLDKTKNKNFNIQTLCQNTLIIS